MRHNRVPEQVTDSDAVRIARACRRIESGEPAPGVATLAREAGMTSSRFHRIFKQATGVTPHAYAQSVRWRRAEAELETSATVTDAMHAAGFESSGRFYADSSARLGMTPRKWRSAGQGETIRFAVGECSLGQVLVAESERGVCAIMLGDDPEILLHDLQQRFSQAGLVGAEAGYENRVAQVIGLIESPGSDPDLPLDIRGTAFQQRVWQALRAIPAGETASYTEIARRIGLPTAARAVARACADNKLAVAIPCHRVVRSDGGLSGYRWGIARKRSLLHREAEDQDATQMS